MPTAKPLSWPRWRSAPKKAFGAGMELLLRMQAGYDAAQARRRATEIDVRRYHPNVTPAAH